MGRVLRWRWRGRGLLVCAAQRREPALLAVLPQLVEGPLTAMLRDDESYVYLAAVNVLATLADVAPQAALPLLTEKLAAAGEGEAGEGGRALGLPLRLLLTEALEKAARGCGELLPHYAPHFVRAFLGARAPAIAQPSVIPSGVHRRTGPALAGMAWRDLPVLPALP
eukprot:COSAG01_NODE_9107_length_2551_cov_5.829119_1_plen_167_part_00